MNLRSWLHNLLSLLWAIAHPRQARKIIAEAGDMAARVLRDMRGFTLIELLIVLAILGLIVGVVAMAGASNVPIMIGG